MTLTVTRTRALVDNQGKEYAATFVRTKLEDQWFVKSLFRRKDNSSWINEHEIRILRVSVASNKKHPLGKPLFAYLDNLFVQDKDVV